MRPGFWLLAAVVIAILGLAAPVKAAESPFSQRLVGIEVAVPTYVKAGATYTMTLRFAGVTLGDPAGVWVTNLKATGLLNQDNLPVQCSPDSAVTIVGGDWALHTLSGEIQGQVSGGRLAFRPDRPILGSCMGPVPADLALTVDSASGRYASIASVTVSQGIIDHRIVPPTIGADVLLDR